MPARNCKVTITDADGCRHSVEVTASSLFEAAALGARALRQYPWGAATLRATTAKIEVVVCGPSEGHEVTVAQLNRWLHTPPRSPKEKLLKDGLADDSQTPAAGREGRGRSRR